jgi:hypothetical protein
VGMPGHDELAALTAVIGDAAVDGVAPIALEIVPLGEVGSMNTNR